MKTKQNNTNKQIFSVANSQKQILWAMAMIILFSVAESNHIRIPESDMVYGIVCIFFLYAEIKAAYILDCSKLFILILVMMPIATLYAQFFGSSIKLSAHYSDVINSILIINFIQLLYLNWQATRTLKYSGIRVGLMGAKDADLMEFARVNRG